MIFIEQNDYVGLKRALSNVNVVDIAEFLEELDSEKMLLVFRILPKDVCVEVFSYMTPEQQQHVIVSITDKEVRHLINELFLDDTVDFLEELPAGIVKKVLTNVDEEKRKQINQFLQYKPASVGSIMTVEFVELQQSNTVKQAIDTIRKTGLDKETIYTCYCINEKRQLVGIVPLRALILSDDDEVITEIMTTNLISLQTHDDREEAADLIRKYDFLSIPVVDSENRLVGIVTVDDALDVIEEETTEDFEKMAAITPSENEYLKSSVFTLAKNRIIWLIVLMFSAMVTGGIISKFENILAQMMILMSFIPMLTDTGGNAGSQSATLIIRGLALGEVKSSDLFKIVWKELRVSLICGSVLAAANFARLIITGTDIVVSCVVCLSVMFTVIVSKIIGGSLPILAKNLRLDPAIMASPLITTIVDSLALIIYFLLAKTMLNL